MQNLIEERGIKAVWSAFNGTLFYMPWEFKETQIEKSVSEFGRRFYCECTPKTRQQYCEIAAWFGSESLAWEYLLRMPDEFDISGMCGKDIETYVDVERINFTSDAGFFEELNQNTNISDYVSNDSRQKRLNESLSKLREKNPKLLIGIFSNSTDEYVSKVMGLLEIPDMFSKKIYSNGREIRSKPDLSGFKEIVRLSECVPNKILYIGNDMGRDIFPAQQVGVQTCLVWRREKASEAKYTVFHPSEILEGL